MIQLMEIKKVKNLNMINLMHLEKAVFISYESHFYHSFILLIIAEAKASAIIFNLYIYINIEPNYFKGKYSSIEK